MADEGFKRKLTAILSADVEGYSRLMDDDEAATVRTLTSYRSGITDLVQQFSGRVVDSPGDNILAEFTSVVDAVQCAVKVQKELKVRNQELPEDTRLEFRNGINIGDVIQDDDRLFGDGVNVAARIEGLVEATLMNAFLGLDILLEVFYFLNSNFYHKVREPRSWTFDLKPEDISEIRFFKNETI
jgi:class 3 adenylate cyclase